MLFALRCKFKVIRRSDDAKPLHLVKQGVALQAESGGCSARTSELPIGALAGGENSSAHLFFKRRICDSSNHPRNIRCNGVEYRSSSLTTVIRTVNQDDLGRRLPERFGGAANPAKPPPTVTVLDLAICSPIRFSPASPAVDS